eukprot:321067-Karenia_brevis.AAC.1
MYSTASAPAVARPAYPPINFRLQPKQFEHGCNVDLTKSKPASSTLQSGYWKHMRKPRIVGTTVRIRI